MTSKALVPTPKPRPGNIAKLEPLVERVRELVDDAKADNTKTAYASDWARFEAWCEAHGLEPLPPAAETVATHLADLAQEGMKVSTIERALSGIAFHFRKQGHDWETPKLVREMLKGLRRKLGVKRDKKEPAEDTILRAMVATFGVDLPGLRNRAILTLGWTGAFRRSEVVAFDVEDIQYVPEGLIAVMRKSKTDQEREGVERAIPLAENKALCPVRSLQAWLKAAEITRGPLFRAVTAQGHVREARLSDRSVADFVKQAAEAAGLDAAIFSGHSLRAGFMTTAAKQGRPLHEIMQQSGHQSERVARGYIRHANLFTRNAAKGLL
ncbi:MAG TPA: site-specific integrase [Solirubrobacteraceae bacterium]|nr:site-specific integrase [Solirubrobacteraceae bacterium]HME71147.1 site-specific integrase [Myxococcota bacterium]